MKLFFSHLYTYSMPVKVCILLANNSGIHFHFIPYTFCLYVILTSFFLQGSLCAPSNSTGRFWMKSSVNLSHYSHAWVFYSCDNFWNQPLPLPTSILAMSHYCWMQTSRWGSNIFSSIFCSFPCLCLLLGWFSAASPGRKGSIPASQGCFLQLHRT